MKVKRRSVLAGIGASTVASSASARGVFRISGGAFPGTQAITAVNLSGNTFIGGSPSGTVVGAISVTMSPSSPAFSGSLSLTGTNAASFQIVGASLETNGVVANGTYSINIVATQGGVVGSPFSQPETITGSTGGGPTLFVNQSLGPGPMVSGDDTSIRAINLASVPTGLGGLVIQLIPAAGPPRVINVGPLGYPSSIDTVFSLYNSDTQALLPAGNYTFKLVQHDTGLSTTNDVPVTIAAWKQPPFSFIGDSTQANNELQIEFSPRATSGIINTSIIATEVAGTIGLSGNWQQGAPAGNSIPVNVTLQFTLYTPLRTKVIISGQLFAASNASPMTTTYDTTLQPDGVYALSADIIDIADTFHSDLPGKWTAAQMIAVPTLLVINNHASLPQNPTASYYVPIWYNPRQGRYGSLAIDWAHYQGLPQRGNLYPYPSPTLSPVFAPPTTSVSSPYHGSPAALRNTANWYVETLTQPQSALYKTANQFAQSANGAVIFLYFTGENGVDIESAEISYPGVVKQSYLDGPRNSNMLSSATVMVPTPPTGPFGAYHWTGVQVDGRLFLIDTTGTVQTIGGQKRDISQLPVDWTSSAVPEFPNSVPVGSIDPTLLYTFGDFGGCANDVCWDPRDPYICYVAQTLDHCIVKLNYHSQTIAGVTYGPLVNFTGTISGGTTLTVTGASGAFLGAGYQILTGAHPGTTIVSPTGPSGNGTYTITPSQASIGPVAMSGIHPIGQRYVGYKGGALAALGIATDVPATYTSMGGFADGTALDPTDPTIPKVTFTASIAGTDMNVTVISGTLRVGHMLTGASASAPFLSGTMVAADAGGGGGIGHYTLNRSQTLSSTAGLKAWGGAAQLNGPHSLCMQNVPGITGHPVGTMYIADKYSCLIRKVTAETIDGNGNQAVVSTVSTLVGLHGGAIPVPPQAFNNPDDFTATYDPSKDFYSSPTPVAYPNVAYSIFPESIKVMSTGDVLFSEARYNNMVRRIWLSGAQVGNLTRVGNFGDIGPSASSGAFGTISIDTLGVAGPVDDILITQSGSAGNGLIWRRSVDGTSYSAAFRGDEGPDFPIEGTGGSGHYPWWFSWSLTEARYIAGGAGNAGVYSGRSILPGDPVPNDYVSPNGNIYGYGYYRSGTVYQQDKNRAMFPELTRPSFAAFFGAAGQAWLGANVSPNIDDFAALYPTDFNPAGANGPTGQAGTLAGYIQGGVSGAVPRPEFAVNDDVTPHVMGRPLRDLVYFFRRQSLPGSYPTLETLPPCSDDCTRPVISGVSYNRINSTTIHATWTTDKNTIGVIAAGSPNSQGVAWNGYYQFNCSSPLEATYGTSHSATVTSCPDITVAGQAPTYVCILVLDKSGNFEWSATTTVS